MASRSEQADQAESLTCSIADQRANLERVAEALDGACNLATGFVAIGSAEKLRQIAADLERWGRELSALTIDNAALEIPLPF